MDSTHPVTTASDYIYDIIQHYYYDKEDNGRRKTNTATPMSLVICCHKCCHPKAKNNRRIKLQLRNELQQLSQLKKQRQQQSDNDKDIGIFQELDWEHVLNDTTFVQFCSTNIVVGSSSSSSTTDTNAVSNKTTTTTKTNNNSNNKMEELIGCFLASN